VVANGEGVGGRGEREREEKVKRKGGESRWREEFGPPKNFGVAPL